MSTTLQDVLKQVEDLKEFPGFTTDLGAYDPDYANGAQAAFGAVIAYLLSRIEHDRGRG